MSNEILLKNNFDINHLLCKYIEKNEPFSCIRLGNTENYILNTLYENQLVHEWWYRYLFNVAGVFPLDLDFYKDSFLPKNIEAIKNSDIVGWVAITQVEPLENFKNNILKNKNCFTDLDFLDPAYLIDYDVPWTSLLKDKKVLVVSPHYSTIIQQWKKRKNIWGDNVDKILPFELVDVVKSPHPPHIEGGELEVNGKELKTWIDAEQYLENEISNYDFDFLLVGAGAYGPSLCSFAKSIGKMAIQPGGATQLFFGICGKRWTENENFKKQQNCFNQYWIYPLEDDKPQNVSIVEGDEGNCYW